MFRQIWPTSVPYKAKLHLRGIDVKRWRLQTVSLRGWHNPESPSAPRASLRAKRQLTEISPEPHPTGFELHREQQPVGSGALNQNGGMIRIGKMVEEPFWENQKL